VATAFNKLLEKVAIELWWIVIILELVPTTPTPCRLCRPQPRSTWGPSTLVTTTLLTLLVYLNTSRTLDPQIKAHTLFRLLASLTLSIKYNLIQRLMLHQLTPGVALSEHPHSTLARTLSLAALNSSLTTTQLSQEELWPLVTCITSLSWVTEMWVLATNECTQWSLPLKLSLGKRLWFNHPEASLTTNNSKFLIVLKANRSTQPTLLPNTPLKFNNVDPGAEIPTSRTLEVSTLSRLATGKKRKHRLLSSPHLASTPLMRQLTIFLWESSFTPLKITWISSCSSAKPTFRLPVRTSLPLLKMPLTELVSQPQHSPRTLTNRVWTDQLPTSDTAAL
jgi:hypothetical protein